MFNRAHNVNFFHSLQSTINHLDSFSASPSSGVLRIVAPDMRDGEYVEIQCEGAAPEDEGRIEWYFNGRVSECVLCFRYCRYFEM